MIVLQALLDRHAMLRLRVNDDASGGWSLTVPEPGSVDAGACLHTVDELSDEALTQARSRLNPAAGTMLSALWATRHRAAGPDHPPPGRRRGVLANPVGRLEHRLGPTSQRPTDDAAGSRHLICPLVITARRTRPHSPQSSTRPTVGDRQRPPRPHCRRYNPRSIPMPAPGTCRHRWMSRRPACCSARCPRRFTPGSTTSC